MYLFLIQFFVEISAYVIAGFSFGWSDVWGQLIASEDYIGISLWANFIGTILIGVLYTYWNKRTYLLGDMEFSLRKTWNWKSMAWLLLLGFLLQLLVDFVLETLFYIPAMSSLMEDYVQVTENLEMGSSFRAFLYTVLAAPVVEEILFRGTVLGYLRKGFSDRAAVVIAALFFAIVHFNWVQGSYAFVLGILLGYLCCRTKSLWTSIFLHMFMNLGSFFVFLVPDFLRGSPLRTGVMAIVMGTAVFFACRGFERSR